MAAKKKYLKNQKTYLPEMLDIINEHSSVQDRIEILNEYIGKGNEYKFLVRSFIECLYHPGVEFDLPEGTPPYRPQTNVADYDFAGSSLFVTSKKISKFCNNTRDKISNKLKRERYLMQLLEMMHPRESELLIAMKDKKLPKQYKRFNEGLARKAFPEWLPPKEATEGAPAELKN